MTAQLELRFLYDDNDDHGDVDELPRPRTRADCLEGPRPCPWVSCRYHLLTEVSAESGSLVLNLTAPGTRGHAGRPPVAPGRKASAAEVDRWVDAAVEQLDRMPETCALDVAEQGEHTLESVGRCMGVSDEQVYRIARGARRRLPTKGT